MWQKWWHHPRLPLIRAVTSAVKHFDNPSTFIEYSGNINEICENTEDIAQGKVEKYLLSLISSKC